MYVHTLYIREGERGREREEGSEEGRVGESKSGKKVGSVGREGRRQEPETEKSSYFLSPSCVSLRG